MFGLGGPSDEDIAAGKAKAKEGVGIAGDFLKKALDDLEAEKKRKREEEQQASIIRSGLARMEQRNAAPKPTTRGGTIFTSPLGYTGPAGGTVLKTILGM